MENQSISTNSSKKILTGSNLKLIAIVAMFIDHTGHTIVWKLYL